ncbi:MAG: FkbM family methyltransferase [Opitutae bacterium]|nr:FkbM family methyltransferase [Opitutae bacterium]
MNPLKALLPAGRAPRTVLSGLLAGIRLHLDLRSEAQIWLGLYERETYADIRRLLRGCRGAIDLGAAKGDLSIHFLRQPGMERVVAAEPLDTERAQLAANLALNRLAGDPRLSLHPGFAGRGEPPLWRTLDDLAAGVPAPLFLKIDIDGPEAGVLADGCETLRSKDCRLLIETHSPAAEHGCLTQLRELGYTVRIIPPAWWRVLVREHRPIPHNRWLAAWRGTPA